MNYAYREGYNEGYRKGYEDGMAAFMENYSIKLVMNAEDAKEYKISEDGSKRLEELLKCCQSMGGSEQDEDSN